jgi:ElaB/YqjD/DUF883 family membrane-anchored ribosome-binding protein
MNDMRNDMAKLALKEDVDHLRDDVTRLQGGLDSVQSDLTVTIDKRIAEAKAEIKADISDMKTDLRHDIGELRQLLFQHVSDHEKHGKPDVER